MLNSSNYARDGEILNAGQEVVQDLQSLKDPNAKIYYHRVPGAQTHLPDGAAIVFRGGQFVTANPELIEFLDKIADKPASMVYTKSSDRIDAAVKSAALSAASPASSALDSISQPVVKMDELKTADDDSQLNKSVLNADFVAAQQKALANKQ